MKLGLYYHWHQGLDYTSLWIREPSAVQTQGRLEWVSEDEGWRRGGWWNAAHVDHSHCLCHWLPSKRRPVNKRDCEKRRDCNVRWLGMSGKMSCRVVLLRRRSQEINGGLCQMAPLQLRTNRQQTGIRYESCSFKAHYHFEFPRLAEKMTSEWVFLSYPWVKAPVCFKQRPLRSLYLFLTTALRRWKACRHNLLFASSVISCFLNILCRVQTNNNF